MENPWDQRQPIYPTEDMELKPIPGHYRFMLGLLPLCATTVFDGVALSRYPEVGERFVRFLDARPEIRAAIHDPLKSGIKGRRLASILDETRLRRVLARSDLDAGECTDCPRVAAVLRIFWSGIHH